VWQSDLVAHEVRSVVAEIIAALRDELGAVDPLVLASWVTTAQPELAMSPEEWLAAGKERTEITGIARPQALIDEAAVIFAFEVLPSAAL
jgi:hypothetical protein